MYQFHLPKLRQFCRGSQNGMARAAQGDMQGEFNTCAGDMRAALRCILFKGALLCDTCLGVGTRENCSQVYSIFGGIVCDTCMVGEVGRAALRYIIWEGAS